MHSSKRLAATSLWEARSLEEAGLFQHLAQCPLRLTVHDHDEQRAREWKGRVHWKLNGGTYRQTGCDKSKPSKTEKLNFSQTWRALTTRISQFNFSVFQFLAQDLSSKFTFSVPGPISLLRILLLLFVLAFLRDWSMWWCIGTVIIGVCVCVCVYIYSCVYTYRTPM